MRKISRRFPALTALFVSLNLMSCMEEELVAPVHPDSKNVQPNTSNLVANKQYLLAKQNNITFEYNASKELTKVTYSPGHYVTYEVGVEESDPPEEQYQRRKNMTYIEDKLVKIIEFPLNDGEFYESFTRFYGSNAGNAMNDVNYGYEFNYQGKLKKRYVKNNPLNRIEFVYNIEVAGTDIPGDLVKVLEYTSTGALKQTTEFTYSAKAPADKYGFYPEISDIDPFDRCMGTLSRKLPTTMKINYANPLMTDMTLHYEYQLDANGYPMNRKTYKYFLFKKELVDITTYKYL